MIIKSQNKYQGWFINKLQGLVWRLENTGNGDFTKNGELSFLASIGNEYKNKPFVFFDIGANIGEYTDMVLKNSKNSTLDAHLFEPQSTCFATLVNKFSKQNNIHINSFGLSSSANTLNLYKDHDQSGLASLYKRDLKYYKLEMGEAEKISLEMCSTYITKNLISKINLIKIDIEGHELEALKGFGDFLHAKNVDFIQFEYGGANLDSKTSLLDLFNFFSEKGFVVCKMMKNGLTKHTYNPRFENFMYQNWVAVSPNFINDN